LADMQISICQKDRKVEGGIWLKLDWELFSPRERRVVYRGTHAGSFQTTTQVENADFYEAGLRAAVRNLLSDPAFVAQATQRAQPSLGKDAELLAIATRFNGGQGSQARMPELQSSVVTIFTGAGSGSGFYVSADGYLLTNQHVVGDAKFVKIKLANGRDLLGEVLRSAAERDVALVKTEAVALAPMALASTETKVGEEVYALGSPFGESLSQSVTRGIVSGIREIEKVRWLQSDVTIAPGSSGGPLIDAAGGVVGLARGGIRGANVNFFVPIAEAMSALKIGFRQP
jgi:serine protease Do